jgi:hypothetical protein
MNVGVIVDAVGKHVVVHTMEKHVVVHTMEKHVVVVTMEKHQKHEANKRWELVKCEPKTC